MNKMNNNMMGIVGLSAGSAQRSGWGKGPVRQTVAESVCDYEGDTVIAADFKEIRY